MNINNYLETKIRELNSMQKTSYEFEDLYSDIQDEKLKTVFCWIHAEFIALFRSLNNRLPTGDSGAHFWAEPSRELIYIIELTLEMKNSLKHSALSFKIDEYYENIIKKCRDFLCQSGGSAIPPHMQKIELYYTLPIFISSKTIKITTQDETRIANLHSIGEGSYATVYKFRDNFYGKEFVLKKAKKDLNEKELARFKREFEEMKALNSPYVTEVYSYNDTKHEYIMELMDCTLEKYISTNNDKLNFSARINIILQIIKGFQYLHSKNILHRDVSPRNILLKCYDDVIVVKISDFGLVKLLNSELTSENSELKGSLNDPSLKVSGFANYNMAHEIYALTLLCAFILTGKTNYANIKNLEIRKFMEKGANADMSKRYKDLEELKQSVLSCVENIK